MSVRPRIDVPAPLEPITLQPRFVERVWGSDTLPAWYPAPVPGARIGEVWLTAEECLAGDGAETLASVAAQHPVAFGNEALEGFPLLIKVLCPQEKLSVQVHPDDADARRIAGHPRGKTECWYILAAEPGAQVAVGFAEEMTTEDVRVAIEKGNLESRLRMLDVTAGDLVFVDAGTVHAIGPGVVILEIQQYSDVTYRLWDYGRPRELHVKQGLAVMKLATEAGLVAPVAKDGFIRLVASSHFIVDKFKVHEGTKALGNDGEMQILIPLGTDVRLVVDERTFELQAGCATVLPAGTGAASLASLTAVDVMRILGGS